MLTLGVVFNFHINPETPARKHAPASGGGGSPEVTRVWWRRWEM